VSITPKTPRSSGGEGTTVGGDGTFTLSQLGMKIDPWLKRSLGMGTVVFIAKNTCAATMCDSQAKEQQQKVGLPYSE